MFRNVILDFGRNDACVFVAGTGRSGTTWIAQILASMTGARHIFEPCLLDGGYEFATLKHRFLNESYALRDYQLYIPPGLGESSAYFRPLSRILQGRVKNEWCDKFTHSGVYTRRVIKEIRANLFLAYLSQTWPNLRIIWVIRDVFDTINSQVAMSKREWHFDWDHQQIVSQQQLLDDWLAAYLPSMRLAVTTAERLAHRWCVETMVPYWQGVQARRNVQLVRYEQLINDVSVWESIVQFVRAKSWSRARLTEVLRRPSPTSRKLFDDSGDRGCTLDNLSAEDIAAIRRIVALYGAARVTEGK